MAAIRKRLHIRVIYWVSGHKDIPEIVDEVTKSAIRLATKEMQIMRKSLKILHNEISGSERQDYKQVHQRKRADQRRSIIEKLNPEIWHTFPDNNNSETVLLNSKNNELYSIYIKDFVLYQARMPWILSFQVRSEIIANIFLSWHIWKFYVKYLIKVFRTQSE